MTPRPASAPEHEQSEDQHQQNDQTALDERRDVGGAPDEKDAENQQVHREKEGSRTEILREGSGLKIPAWAKDKDSISAPVYTAVSLFLLVSLASWAVARQASQPSLGADDPGFITSVRDAERFVVGVRAGQRSGSGWLRTEDGLIVTADDLVVGTDSAMVELRGQTLKAWVVGVDTPSGIAVLQIPRKGVRVPSVAAEASPVKLGQQVITIGISRGGGTVALQERIVGVEQTPTTPSRIRRLLIPSAGYREMRGAPLFDWRGQVVGTVAGPMDNTADLPGAVPVARVDSAVAAVRRRPSAQSELPAWLETAPAGERLGARTIVRVRAVQGGHPGGLRLRVADVIRSMDDTVVTDADTLGARIRNRFPNSLVTFRVQRGDRILIDTAVLRPVPRSGGAQKPDVDPQADPSPRE